MKNQASFLSTKIRTANRCKRITGFELSHTEMWPIFDIGCKSTFLDMLSCNLQNKLGLVGEY